MEEKDSKFLLLTGVNIVGVYVEGSMLWDVTMWGPVEV
jgi:hypothetical protein